MAVGCDLEGVGGMQAFMKEDESLCDFSKFNNCKNEPSHWIHDKRKIVYIHDDARILEIVNRELKITKGAISTAGSIGVVGAVGGRLAVKGKIGTKTSGMLDQCSGR